MTEDFEEFLQARHAAAAAYVSGDPDPLSRLVAHVHPATFFSPRGDVTTGSEEVAARYAQDAEAFEAGSKNNMETLHAAADGDIGFWIGRQRTQARTKGSDDPVPFDLRVTELYRRESGNWRLVHRHADPVDNPG